jgi:uncharacterized protein (TIGR03435 family)
MGPRGDRLVGTNVTLLSLLNYAYAPAGGVFLPSQIIGAPAWANTDHFDVEGKMPEASARPPKVEEMKAALRSLLEDRFQLKAQRETRELPIYNLIVAKSGPKAAADQTPPDPGQMFIHFASTGDPLPALPRGAARILRDPDGTTLTGTAMRMSLLVSLLQGQSDRIIVDRTNFTALFDIQVQFSPAAAVGGDQSSPSLFTAIQEIGLKLEPSKAPLDVVVVESVKKPSAN